MQVYKTTGVKPPFLVYPEFPDELQYIWQWHCELGSKEPLTNSELKAWAELNQVDLRIKEVELLRSLDQLYWRITNE